MDYMKIVEMGLTLAAILAAILVLLWIMKWVHRRGVGPVGRGRRLRLRETLSLDGRNRVVIVEADGRDYLMLLGDKTDLLLDRDLPGIARRDDSPEPDLAAPNHTPHDHTPPDHNPYDPEKAA